ncbi:MAG: M3 family metallopeptidase, partial [Gammaproteobacteria bacterium]|nr:M3 family metallopeptidase [Gammaproteobacteria bacterium]
LFDMRIHGSAADGDDFIAEQLQKTREQVAVIQPPTFNRFQHSFGHIFAGGYAAGYFSYKWAEVLSADAFSAFEETAVFDQETGQRFKQEVLEMGGSRTAAENFKAFRGREPEIEPLLRHSGIAA